MMHMRGVRNLLLGLFASVLLLACQSQTEIQRILVEVIETEPLQEGWVCTDSGPRLFLSKAAMHETEAGYTYVRLVQMEHPLHNQESSYLYHIYNIPFSESGTGIFRHGVMNKNELLMGTASWRILPLQATNLWVKERFTLQTDQGQQSIWTLTLEQWRDKARADGTVYWTPRQGEIAGINGFSNAFWWIESESDHPETARKEWAWQLAQRLKLSDTLCFSMP